MKIDFIFFTRSRFQIHCHICSGQCKNSSQILFEIRQQGTLRIRLLGNRAFSARISAQSILEREHSANHHSVATRTVSRFLLSAYSCEVLYWHICVNLNGCRLSVQDFVSPGFCGDWNFYTALSKQLTAAAS